MSVPASTVRKLGTAADVAFIRASRKPALEKLSAVELKKLARQARKELEKWQKLERGQSRARSRAAGFGESAENTRLRGQMFREALEGFEKRLATLEATPATKAKAKAKSSVAGTKKARAGEHRAKRAAVRQVLAEKELHLNTTRGAKKKLVVPVPKPRPAAVAKASGEATPAASGGPGGEAPQAVAPAVKPRARRSGMAVALGHPQSEEINVRGQLRARQAAMQARIANSGITTRQKGHTLARGKRKQARRDARN